MPKIPTFTAKGTITGEAASVTGSVQAPLSMAKTLAPLQKSLAEYSAKEKIIQNKTEALKLENKSIVELNTAVQTASRMMNKEQANLFLKTESSKIRNKYRDQASSASVQRIFDGNYLMEEQKQIYKVDGAVYKNIIENHKNEKSIKTSRTITEGLYGDNPLQEKELYNDLVKIENDDLTQDDQNREANIKAIPGKIEYFKAKKSITKTPTQALKDIRAGLEGPYKNLPLDVRQELEREALVMAKPAVIKNVKNHLSRLSNNIDSKIDDEEVKKILGVNAYTTFKKTETITLKTRNQINQINNSKIGDEQSIIDSFIPNLSKATALELEAKQKLVEVVSKKKKILQKDPASLIVSTNQEVKNLYKDYQSETNDDKRSIKFKKYIDTVKIAQIDMGLNKDDVKLIPNSSAISLVKQYNDIDNPRSKISFLNRLENEYGDDNYSILLRQLSENDLPVTAKLVSYFGNEVFSEKALSIDSKEERKILDDYITKSDETKSNVRKAVANELIKFRVAVMTANPYDTSKANKELNEIETVMTYLTISEMSKGNIDLDDAVEKSTSIITENFQIEDSYFIPKIYNNERLSDGQVNFIKDKAELIKNQYIDKLDLIPMQSSDKTVSKNDLNTAMYGQVKENGVWLNKANGDGLFLAIKFPDGEYGDVIMKDTEGKKVRVEIDFDDGTFFIPNTNIQLDFGQTKKESEVQVF